MDDLSVDRTKAIEEATDVGDDGFHTGPVPLATFHLHIDNNQTCRLGMQFNFL
jgi:hypothetical protein